ncbi:hypothetical protein Btru_064128 [Bulinus truncatus]|nr:hypothetical protein Btru_064128 [Bulinus truncatus]
METMSEYLKSPSDDSGLANEDASADLEDDVYAQLAQKERDLILAAELGKALLDSNQELQLRYDHAVDEFSHKIEDLQQEKHDLHLELEKIETEYQNAMKDLQDDVISLRKQLRDKDDLKISERERSRSLREAQINSDYYMDEIRKASKREEELVVELSEQREKIDSSAATIKDQMDHIAMLRDQVEYLSGKLKESNQKLTEVQVERDALINTLESAQEQIQSLELKITLQEEKIHRQACEIEELQEVNSDLQLQLDHQQQHPYHRHLFHRKSAPPGIINSKNKNFNNSSAVRNIQTNTLFHEITQEKLKQNQNHPDKTTAVGVDKKLSVENDQRLSSSTSESVVLSEVNSGKPLSIQPISAEFAQCHSRNASNCSLSSLAEGSRKRHHQNVGNGSDDDSETDMDNTSRNYGCKQTLYTFTSNNCVSGPSLDSNGNSMLLVKSSNIFKKDTSGCLSTEYLQDPHSAFDENDILSESSSKCSSPGDISKPLFDDLLSYSDKNTQALALTHIAERQETSLFSELSSQLFEDKAGSGSDSSSNYMLGVFDFCPGVEPSSHEVDGHSSESLNQSMEIRSRLESDLSMTSEWYYMTPVTSEMLEGDDFECDDDDFLVGNLAGTTLSICDTKHDTNYTFHSIVNDDEKPLSPQLTVDKTESSYCAEQDASHDKQQQQLTLACLQLKELIIKMQGHSDISDNLETRPVTTEDLLSLVAQMRVCVDNVTSDKVDVYKNADSLIQS